MPLLLSCPRAHSSPPALYVRAHGCPVMGAYFPQGSPLSGSTLSRHLDMCSPCTYEYLTTTPALCLSVLFGRETEV